MKTLKESSGCWITLRNSFLIVVLIVFVLPALSASDVHAQNKVDSLKIMKILRSEGHSASKAALYSAFIPGWGQAYNKKYWKIPIVYLGLAGAAYAIVYNSSDYKLYKSELARMSNDDANELPTTNYSDYQLTSAMNNSRKYRDYSVIALVAWYGLNILDANIDAHFINYTVSDDLSFKVKPDLFPSHVSFDQAAGQGFGMGFSLIMEFR